jgi:hypothetical protein
MAERHWLRRKAAAGLAAVLLLTLYGFTRQPTVPDDERRALASRFAFERRELPVFSIPPHQHVRAVHPAVEHISAWISAVGASVALGDLDGDGLANDACIVDPRIDMVMASPLPGSGDRFPYFVLDPFPLPYERATMAPMGCLLADLNEDGWTDVVAYYWGRTPVAFLRRVEPGGETAFTGQSRFRPVEILAGAGRRPPLWNTTAMTLADIDGDGHLDLVVGNYFPDGAPVLDPPSDRPWPMQDSRSRATNAGANRILRWAGATTGAEPTVAFEEAAGALDAEVAGGWTLAVAAADLDGDLLPEIYFANDFGPDRLLHNRSTPGRVRLALLEGVKGPATPSSKVLGRDSFKGMGVDFGDLNDDGLLDIFVSNIAQEYSLEESHFAFVATGETARMAEGVAPFVDQSERLGLARSFFSWEARLADFDNDGVLEAMQATGFVRGEVDRWPELQELATGNDQRIKDPRSWPRFAPGDDISGRVHNPFFVRAASGRYVDLAAEVGLGEAYLSRGIAVGDVDRDGDLDFALANQWSTSYLFYNRSRAAGRYLGLRLLLPVDGGEGGGAADGVRVEPAVTATRGRPAVGAQATVRLADGRRWVRQVDGGNGHSGASTPELFFGLGAVPDGEAASVDIAWRDGSGRRHAATLELAPGWHTVVLGGGPQAPPPTRVADGEVAGD